MPSGLSSLKKNKTLFTFFFLFLPIHNMAAQAYHPFEYYATEQHKRAFPCCGTKINLLKKEIAGTEMHAPVSKESMLIPNTWWGKEH